MDKTRLKRELDLLAVTLDLPVEQVVNRVLEKGLERERKEDKVCKSITS